MANLEEHPIWGAKKCEKKIASSGKATSLSGRQSRREEPFHDLPQVSCHACDIPSFACALTIPADVERASQIFVAHEAAVLFLVLPASFCGRFSGKHSILGWMDASPFGCRLVQMSTFLFLDYYLDSAEVKLFYEDTVHASWAMKTQAKLIPFISSNAWMVPEHYFWLLPCRARSLQPRGRLAAIPSLSSHPPHTAGCTTSLC
jgi:hypothetical protein